MTIYEVKWPFLIGKKEIKMVEWCHLSEQFLCKSFHTDQFLKQSTLKAFEALHKVDKKIKTTSFDQYSWNSKVEKTWISLIGWPHKTSNLQFLHFVLPCTINFMTIWSRVSKYVNKMHSLSLSYYAVLVEKRSLLFYLAWWFSIKFFFAKTFSEKIMQYFLSSSHKSHQL